MSESPRTYKQALEHAQAEARSRSTDWTAYCQRFVRECYGIAPLFSSAWTQWLGADDEDKHRGTNPATAPVGAALCFKGSGPYGHIMLAANTFAGGTAAAWSNDLVRTGYINKVSRTAPTTQWGQQYLGYLTAVNDYDLRLKEVKPPKPKQDKRYKAIDRAITKLEIARETAIEQHDRDDRSAIAEEIKDLKRLYAKLRRY